MTLTVEEGGIRLDLYLAAKTGLTRSYIKQLIERGLVLVNGEKVKSGKIIRCQDSIDYDTPTQSAAVEARDIPVEILYEDDDIAVVNKPQGLTVHPAAGNYDNTLVNALLFRLGSLSTINGVVRPGIVHRLDKNTSGVMAVAKNDAAHLCLARQIENRSVTKIYLALLEGNLKEEEGVVVTKIGRDPKNRQLMTVTETGREAITAYRVRQRYRKYCLVEFRLVTGRTHQIRVHCKHLGHPVVGDPAYGFKKQEFKLNGQLLHSYSLTLKHPVSGLTMTFTAPLPSYFNEVLSRLEKI